ncbi:hypothetical protein FA95DRAFT_1607609 [Auriscalpium vulgare]|uniref:Uncharacterized protein n=1 Tax=Auriscalpium vulgare TaxID=40419 RepID=A0ACB8RNX0_9AGAM|nr:hypothetical protein FA95DRAFT_1607609 [Auriscalpium vulgare]
MATLPYDVYVEIIDWVYRASQHATLDRCTLRTCALVCKAWTFPAQRLLFRRTWAAHPQEPFGPVQRAQLLRAVRANPLLGTHVRNIVVPATYAAATLDADGLALLALCPNVRALHITVLGDTAANVAACLRALPLRPAFLRVRGTLASVALIVQLWPGLHGLDVRAYAFEAPGHHFPIRTPRSVAVDWDHAANAHWILAKADVSALRELEVSRAVWDDKYCMDTFLRTPAIVHITSLVLDGALPPQAVLDRCSALETIVFAEPPEETVVLPRTLRHVGFHTETRGEGGQLTYLAAALRALKSLRLVTTSRALSGSALENLTHLCGEMNVEVGFYSGACLFPRIKNQDWI